MFIISNDSGEWCFKIVLLILVFPKYTGISTIIGFKKSNVTSTVILSISPTYHSSFLILRKAWEIDGDFFLWILVRWVIIIINILLFYWTTLSRCCDLLSQLFATNFSAKNLLRNSNGGSRVSTFIDSTCIEHIALIKQTHRGCFNQWWIGCMFVKIVKILKDLLPPCSPNKFQEIQTHIKSRYCPQMASESVSYPKSCLDMLLHWRLKWKYFPPASIELWVLRVYWKM